MVKGFGYFLPIAKVPIIPLNRATTRVYLSVIICTSLRSEWSYHELWIIGTAPQLRYGTNNFNEAIPKNPETLLHKGLQ